MYKWKDIYIATNKYMCWDMPRLAYIWEWILIWVEIQRGGSLGFTLYKQVDLPLQSTFLLFIYHQIQFYKPSNFHQSTIHQSIIHQLSSTVL